MFVTRCKFNFPREACASSKLNPVEESLKARNKIYQLARSELEVRVNDYNPLLLYVWKANIDIQFVAESSLALAHYVSGYVTKAERSNLQEIWQDVSENKSIYSASGVLAYVVYALESVASMKLLIFSSEITSQKSPALYSG